MDNSDNIPEQISGGQTNSNHSVTAKKPEEAIEIFKRASDRLLNINIWHKLAGKASADFALVGQSGEEKHRVAKVNDYFKIDIPGPGPATGDGYDWVRVEKIEEKLNPAGEEESVTLQVRPCSNPNNNNNDTAHFLSDDATSTFIINRNNNTVTAAVYGRNEKPNNSTNNIIDKVRNTVVGTGAIAGVSKIQWSLLVKALLADEVPD